MRTPDQGAEPGASVSLFLFADADKIITPAPYLAEGSAGVRGPSHHFLAAK